LWRGPSRGVSDGRGPIYFAALLHADAAVDNLLIQEMNRAWFDRYSEWVEHDWRLTDGFLELNDRPGLGITVHEERLATCYYESTYGFPTVPPCRWELEGLVTRMRT
jgi:L-alanine-DL-glutamate epimerase-like enolase superfamily enzyme